MATQVVCTLREDKQGLRKQLRCINGIFQLFDRRYLLGLHRHGRNQNRLNAGEGENVVKEFKISSEKAKEKRPKEMIEKNRMSVESSRNSSSSSTTFSSLDCSRRVQNEWQLPTELTSPNFHKKQPDWSIQPADIRDVVKDSMTKEIRVTKDERARLVMKHVDSPRPSIPQKTAQYDRKDRNLGKVQKASIGVKEIKETSRLSCDERESQYSLKSTFRVKELPRLSLDSKQNSNRKSMNESKREPGSNKRPSLGVVAQLMGLESSTDSAHDVETLKIKPKFNDQLVPNLRWSRKSECKHAHVSVSPRVPLEIKQPLQQQEGSDQGSKKPALKNTKNVPVSVYGQMENRLSALEFKTSGKDLRALKQILEAMQMKKTVLENKEQSQDNQKTNQARLPVINLTSSPKSTFMKPEKMATEPIVIIGVHSVSHVTRNHIKESAPRNKKATGRAPRCLSPSNSPEYAIEERSVSSPRLQRLKNDVDKQGLHGPSINSSKIKEQPNVQPILSALKTRNPKIKPIKPMKNNQQSSRYFNDGDAVPYKLESNTKLATQIKLEVTRTDQPRENHKIIFAGESIEDKPTVELTKHTVEQPSPVSVLDAFYTEDTPSPVKKKSNAFNDYEILHDDDSKENHVRIDILLNSTNTDQYSEFNHKKQESRNHLIHQIELLNPINETIASPCKSTNSDHRYISEILLASGILNDPDSAIRRVQLNPTNSLIQPELFHILEKPNDDSHNSNPRSRISDTMGRKLIFDYVNDILLQKLVVSGTHGLWTGRRCGQLTNGEKLLKELWSEIDNLQSNLERCLYDEDDEVKNLVSSDVNKNSEDWDKLCYEIPGLVLDIERLIFKDLIDEVVNAEVTSLQYRPRRHRRRLFSM